MAYRYKWGLRLSGRGLDRPAMKTLVGMASLFLLSTANCTGSSPSGNSQEGEQERPACHPLIARAIAACVRSTAMRQMQRAEPIEPLSTLFGRCAESSSEIIPWVRKICETKADKGLCSQLVTDLPESLEQCVLHERASYDCAFGASTDTLGAQANISIVDRQELDLRASGEGTTIQRLQLEHLAQSLFGSAGSISGLFAGANKGKIQRIEFYDRSQDQGYTALIVAIDEGNRGLVFRRKTDKSVARIEDNAFVHPQSGALGCRAPLGEAGRRCSPSSGCPEGQACTGAAPTGICIRRVQDLPEQECEEHDSCYPGYCTGRVSGHRSCAPGWMFGESFQNASMEVPDGAAALSHVSILGQASVPLDLELFVSLSHPVDVAQIALEVLIPAYPDQSEEDRPSFRAWPPAVKGVPQKRAQLRLPVRAFGDESINGLWSLRATDLVADGHEGEVLEWGLRYSSRWD